MWFDSDQQFKKNGVISVENDENDICRGVEEMINKILNNVIFKKDDLQNKIYFKNLLNEVIKSYAG